MNEEQSQRPIEAQHLDLEREKFSHSQRIDELKLVADQKAKTWSQVATFVPIVAVVVSLSGGFWLESIRKETDQVAAITKQRRSFIDRQLSEFYYPIQLRLEKDSAVWQLSGRLSAKGKEHAVYENSDFSNYIEKNILLPNHESILQIIDAHFDLLKNNDESYDPTLLVGAIKQYQRHVAAYVALRAVSAPLNPIQACDSCDFPREFPKLIADRITSLERQRVKEN